MWNFGGGGKSAGSTRAQRITTATANIAKGRNRGQTLGTKASTLANRTKTFNQPIATHSRECKHSSCRQPTKITPILRASGKQSFNLMHCCQATKEVAAGFAKHLCSTCHRTGFDCQDKVKHHQSMPIGFPNYVDRVDSKNRNR